QVVLAAQLPPNLLDRGAHLARIFRLGEIGERLVHERAFMETCLRSGGSFNGCHHCTSEDIDGRGHGKRTWLIVAPGMSPLPRVTSSRKRPCLHLFSAATET